MKKALIFILILSLCTIFSGCSGGEADARQVLEKYTQSLQQGDYETAYSLLTSYDQGNISKELFVEWQSTVSKILSIERIDIDKKVDKFKNYEYMGAKFKKTFGYRVKSVHHKKIPDVKTEGYDSEDYRIMVANEEDSLRVALLLTKLEETIKTYNKQLDEKTTE